LDICVEVAKNLVQLRVFLVPTFSCLLNNRVNLNKYIQLGVLNFADVKLGKSLYNKTNQMHKFPNFAPA